MACVSLTALPRNCATNVVGGLEKLWVIAHKDLVPVNAGGDYYTVATSGLINLISLADSANPFVEVGLLRSSAGLQETLTKNVSNGTAFYTQTLTVVLSDVNIDNQKFIESVSNQPVAVLAKTRSGKYLVTGLNGQFELTGVEGGSGTAEGDLVGYTLTFTGIGPASKLVDPTLVPDLLGVE